MLTAVLFLYIVTPIGMTWVQHRGANLPPCYTGAMKRMGRKPNKLFKSPSEAMKDESISSYYLAQDIDFMGFFLFQLIKMPHSVKITVQS